MVQGHLYGWYDGLVLEDKKYVIQCLMIRLLSLLMITSGLEDKRTFIQEYVILLELWRGASNVVVAWLL
jgi:hypothetical protein